MLVMIFLICNCVTMGERKRPPQPDRTDKTVFATDPESGGTWVVESTRFNKPPRSNIPSMSQQFVFAHGAVRDRSDWTIGEHSAMDVLARKGFKSIAFDMPRSEQFTHGESTGPAIETVTQATAMLGSIERAHRVDNPIGVFPSLSADVIAYPILEKHPRALDAAVLIAPVGRFTHANEGDRLDAPALIFLGTG